MSILQNLKIKNKVVEKIIFNFYLFEAFKEIYLFGSIMNHKIIPHDIDLLLIYKKYSDSILIDLENINSILNQVSDLNVDLVVLSEEEEKEFGFISRLNSNYLKIK